MKASYQNNIKRKGAEVVQEEVRQRLVAVGTKLERYGNRRGSSTGRINYLHQTRRNFSTN